MELDALQVIVNFTFNACPPGLAEVDNRNWGCGRILDAHGWNSGDSHRARDCRGTLWRNRNRLRGRIPDRNRTADGGGSLGCYRDRSVCRIHNPNRRRILRVRRGDETYTHPDVFHILTEAQGSNNGHCAIAAQGAALQSSSYPVSTAYWLLVTERKVPVPSIKRWTSGA